MKRITCFIIILLSTAVVRMPAANPNLGTAGAQFLKIPVGAQAAAMGGGYIGLVSDASAVFWNPAGMMNVQHHSAHFTHMKWFEMFDVNAAAYVYDAGNLGAFGLGVLVFSMDKMEITTEMSPNGTGRYFDAQDMALSFSYARKLTDQFQVGVGIRYVNQRIWNETANGISFDVGTQYRIDFNNLTVAMSMRNFGPDMRMGGPDLNVKYDGNDNFPNRLLPTNLQTESFPLPLTFQFGLAFDIFHSQFTTLRAAVDAIHPNDNDERLQIGSELSFYDRLFLRGGIKTNHDDEQYNMGFGVNVFYSGLMVKVDYAFSAYNILPDVHMLSVGMEF